MRRLFGPRAALVIAFIATVPVATAPLTPSDRATTVEPRVISEYVTAWFGGDDGSGHAVPDGVWDFDDGTLQGWTSIDLADVPPAWQYDAAADTATVLYSEAEAEDRCWKYGAGYGNWWRQSIVVDAPYVEFEYETDCEFSWDSTFVYRRDTTTGERLQLLDAWSGLKVFGKEESGFESYLLGPNESIEILFASDELASDVDFYDTAGGFRMWSMVPDSGWYSEVHSGGTRMAVHDLTTLSPQPITPSFSGNVLTAADPLAVETHARLQAEVLLSNIAPVPDGASNEAGLVVEADVFGEQPAGAARFSRLVGVRMFPWLCPDTGELLDAQPIDRIHWSGWMAGIGDEDIDGMFARVPFTGEALSVADSVQVVLLVYSRCEWDKASPCDYSMSNPTPYFDNIRIGFPLPKDVFVDVTSSPLDDAGDARAVAWSDYDGDSDDDLFVANETSGYRLYQNDGGTFSDATSNLPPGSARAGVWGDFDDDGDPDLYLVRDGANTLLDNDGGTFTDATSGPLGNANDGRMACAVDYDNDGYLDIFLVNSAATSSRLFRFDGISWSDVTPANLSWGGTAAAWGDYDGDGDADVVKLEEAPDRLVVYRNDGAGEFAEVLPYTVPISQSLQSVDWMDSDTDGDLDVVAASTGVPLWRNDGADTFYLSALYPAYIWGYPLSATSAADFDLDGDLDLYATASGRNLLLSSVAVNDLDYYTTPTLADTSDGAAAWADIDADGDPDLYLANTNAANRLFRNDQGIVPRLGDGPNGLAVRPLSAAGAPAVGARVRVVAGGVEQIREISGATGRGSQSAPVAFFGLGAATSADSIVTTWPSGELSIQVDVAANQTVEVPVPVPTLALGETVITVDIPIDTRVDVPLVLKNAPLVAPPLLWSVSEAVPCNHVSLLPLAGTVAAGDSAVVALSIDMAGLGETEVTCNVVVTSNDPNNPEVVLPVTVSTRPHFRPAQLDAVHALVDSALTILETDGVSVTATTIGGTGVTRMDNLAVTPLGELYATAAFTTDLYRLDGTTGASLDLGDLGFDAHGLAVDDTDAMWAVSSTGDLYEIDPTVPSAVLVGSTGLGQAMFTAITGLGFDHTTDRLVVLETLLFVTGVYEVDRATADVQLIASSDRGLSAITFDTDGQAFVGDNIEYKSLDMGTGDTTLLGTVPAFINALAAWPSATAVDVPEATSYTFAVRPAAPNPFNPHTRIAFDMAERGHARVDVFDAHGRRVAVLTDGVYGPGRHDVRFDAAGLGSGVYFYRVALPGVVETRKMTLLK